MDITVQKLTTESLLTRAKSFYDVKCGDNLPDIYDNKHTPIRTQLFWIEIHEISQVFSLQIARHSIGVEHFLKGTKHAMMINAEALLNITKKRYSRNSDSEVNEFLDLIRIAVSVVDPALARALKTQQQETKYAFSN
jgi:hypothetical protein